MRHPVTSRSRQRQQASSDADLHAVRVDGHEAQVPVATPDLSLEACGPVGGLSDRRPRVLREPPMAGIHISRGPSTLIAAACGRALGEHLPDQPEDAAAVDERVVDDEPGERLYEALLVGPPKGGAEVAVIEERILNLTHNRVFASGLP